MRGHTNRTDPSSVLHLCPTRILLLLFSYPSLVVYSSWGALWPIDQSDGGVVREAMLPTPSVPYMYRMGNFTKYTLVKTNALRARHNLLTVFPNLTRGILSSMQLNGTLS